MDFNKIKRALSIILVCAMLTPVLTFATGEDVNDTTTGNNKTETVIGVYGDTRTEEQRKKDAMDKAVFATREEVIAAFPTYEFRCETDKLEMYYDARTLGVIIRDKVSGAVMESVMDEQDAIDRKYSAINKANKISGVSIKALVELDEIDRFTKVKESDFMSCIDEGNKAEIVELLDNGFRAKCTFAFHGEEISFNVVVTLDNEGMHAVVPHDSIEKSSEKISIGSMYLYALMGYTERGDREGYMLLPDGNGIIVNFEDFIEYGIETAKFKSGYSERVYGLDLSYKPNVTYRPDAISGTNDAEYVYAPYWGMIHTDTNFAVLAIADQGDINMQIEGVFNGVNNTIENYATGRFIYREPYQDPTSENANSGVETAPDIDFIDDLELTFIFTSGDKANYVGLAKEYQDKLVEEGVLKKDSATGLNVRVDFLGADKEDFLLFKRTVVATTVDNIREIVGSLTESGVNDLYIIYHGWQAGGVNTIPVSDYKVDSSLGGNDAVNKLADDLASKGIDFALGHDALYINASNVKLNIDAVKGLNKFTYEDTRRFEAVYKKFKVLKPSSAAKNLESLVKDYKDNGINGAAILSLPNNLFSYSQKDVLYNKTATLNAYLGAMEKIAENLENISLEQPFKVFWKYTDKFLDMPLTTSMYAYISQEVPFLALVLNGKMEIYSEYVNFEANRTESFLKLAMYGINPSYMLTYENPSILQYTNSNWIYTSEYVYYIDQIARYYKILKQLSDLQEGTTIANYSIYGNVHKVVYGNGVSMYADFRNLYLTVVDANGNVVVSYDAQEECDLTAAGKMIMEQQIANILAVEKAATYTINANILEVISGNGYTVTKYSNGYDVVENVNGDIYIVKDAKAVAGYNENTFKPLAEDKLNSFTADYNTVKDGGANE